MKNNRILAAMVLASGLLLSVLPTGAKAAGAVCTVTGGDHIIKERTVIAATCVKTGTKQMYCTACDEVLVTSEIPATGVHTEEVIPAVEATCTTTGLTEGKKCSVCGEILVAQQTVDKKAHTEVDVPGKEATCTENGLTVGKKCSVCGEVLVAQQEIPAKGHTPVTVPGKEATCTEEGLTDGEKCSVCGEVLTAQQIIAKKAHSYKDGVCTVCGEKDPAYTPAEEPTTAPAASTKGLDNVPKTSDVMPVALISVFAILGMGIVLVKKAFSVR